MELREIQKNVESSQLQNPGWPGLGRFTAHFGDFFQRQVRVAKHKFGLLMCLSQKLIEHLIKNTSTVGNSFFGGTIFDKFGQLAE